MYILMICDDKFTIINFTLTACTRMYVEVYALYTKQTQPTTSQHTPRM